MALYNQPNLTDGIDNIIIDISLAVPQFIPMFLLFIFATIFIGGSIAQKGRTGFADMPMWAVISSMMVVVITMPMTIVLGLINFKILGIVVALSMASFIWLFLDRRNTEI
jgi:hypothetical protein|tara:strand:- start:125 stop:454 length:330 start_codon:yes stop_codon:yes gene_type:complete